jgi:hypothetical protein
LKLLALAKAQQPQLLQSPLRSQQKTLFDGLTVLKTGLIKLVTLPTPLDLVIPMIKTMLMLGLHSFAYRMDMKVVFGLDKKKLDVTAMLVCIVVWIFLVFHDGNTVARKEIKLKSN